MNRKETIKSLLREYLEEATKVSKKVIAYHGTPHGRFEKFSLKKRGTGADISSYGDYGKGYYFTPNKEDAIGYANGVGEKISIKNNQPTLYTVELTMNNPFDMRIISKANKEFSSLMRKFGALNIPEEEYNKVYQKLGITEEYYKLPMN